LNNPHNQFIYFDLLYFNSETHINTYISIFRNLKNNLSPHWEIYVDASKNTEGTAISIIQNNSQIAHCIPMHNSIYTSKYLTLLKATELVTSTKKQCIIIYTDSLSALKNLDNPTKNKHICTRILNILFKTKKNIRFVWVQGHNNISGNEIADEVNKRLLKNR
jgi:ribonuclease HI